jgi:hypothetical protein
MSHQYDARAMMNRLETPGFDPSRTIRIPTDVERKYQEDRARANTTTPVPGPPVPLLENVHQQLKDLDSRLRIVARMIEERNASVFGHYTDDGEPVAELPLTAADAVRELLRQCRETTTRLEIAAEALLVRL